MFAFLSNLNMTDWLQFFSIIASLSISVVSILVAIFTLRQNKKMIEESTRPYILIYNNITLVASVRSYLILKNFGKTGATISEFKANYDMSQFDKKHPPFQNIVGTFIAPGQSIATNIDLPPDLDFSVNFEIKYKTSNKEYYQSCCLNFAYLNDIALGRIHCNDKDLNIIGQVVQEMNEKHL